MAERENMAEAGAGETAAGGGEVGLTPEDVQALATIARLFRNPAVLAQLGQPEQQAERPQRQPSQFGEALNQLQQNLTYIEALENYPPSPDRDEYLRLARERKDNLEVDRDRLLREANERGLFESVKAELSGIYYDARVKVPLKEKEGKDEYEGRSKLLQLSTIQEAAHDPNWVLRDETRLLQAKRLFQGEVRTRLWSDPRIRALEQTYGGAVDYFYRESMDMIVELVKNRHRYTTQADLYPNKGLFYLWKDFAVRDDGGRALRNDEGNEWRVEDFEGVREAIEEARRREPWVSNRGDYETWVQFVADDENELEEMIPYIVAKVKSKLGTGEPQSVYQTLNQENEKLDKASAVFPFTSARKRRRFKSTMTAEISGVGTYHFSELVRKDPGPYFHYAEFLATACKDTPLQDHLVDSWLLDKDGLTMLTSEEYAQNDGEIWRYGKNTRETPKDLDGNHDMGALFRRQQDRRKEIEEYLMGHKLRPMGGADGILNTHPAFQRLKAKFDQLDVADPVSNQQGFVHRWQEYCAKVLRWEQTGEFDDPRDRPRVIFQHPLARAFRPVGFEDEAGNVTQQDEFRIMFEEDTRTDRWYRAVKKRKVRATMEKTERIIRSFQFDVAAGGPRHVFRNQGEPEDLGTLIDEVLPYVPIQDVNEVVPHVTLVRAILQTALKEDKGKTMAQRRFKLYSILTEKLGLDIDSPLFASWYEGANDTTRPALLKYVYQVPELRNLLEVNRRRLGGGGAKLMDGREDPDATDEKSTIARWAQREREFILAAEYVVRKKFGRYFNFPGHDTEDGGVKDFRNANLPSFGISKDTVEVNGLVQEIISPAGDYGKDWGSTRFPLRQLVGLFKGPDEVVFAETGYGGFIENPRDTESWVKRSNGNFTLFQLYTRGDKNSPGSHGMLNDGPVSGVYHLRTFNRVGDNFGKQEAEYGIKHPMTGYDEIKETQYEHYVDAAARVMAPLMVVMHQMFNEEDSNYGRNPGAAMFLATMLWYSTSSWMDNNWYEYRGKFGFAYDGELGLARTFMHTVLKENRLIYNDQEFDEIMVGYTRVEYEDGTAERVIRYKTDGVGNTVERIYDADKGTERDGDTIKEGATRKGKRIRAVEVHEGILDAFPETLRAEIKNKKWLPFGLNSWKPETLDVFKDFDKLEGDRTKKIYQDVVKDPNSYIQKRRNIIRLGEEL